MRTKSKMSRKLITPLYVHVTETNGYWARKQAKKNGISYSLFVNNVLDFAKRSGYRNSSVRKSVA